MASNENFNQYLTINQKNYTLHTEQFQKLETISSHLIYRDIPFLLSKHLFNKINPDNFIEMLDIGCSIGTSILRFSQIIKAAGFRANITGIDLNQAALSLASQRLKNVIFKQVTPQDSLQDLGKFDLIVCNFVLVEMPYVEMQTLLAKANKLLTPKGILVITNPTTCVYRQENRWYALNNDFPNNQPHIVTNERTKTSEFYEDQLVTLQIFDPKTGREIVTFHDFLHTKEAYDNAYKASGFSLCARHHPLGIAEDGIDWISEKEKARVRIDILEKIF